MISAVETSRLHAAAGRIGETAPDIDRRFLHDADGSMAEFIFASEGRPAENARALVSAGLVDPNSPCAVALQEFDDRDRPTLEAWKEPEDLRAKTRQAAEGIRDMTAERSQRLTAMALIKKLDPPQYQGSITHSYMADHFETMTTWGKEMNCPTSTEIASKAFAECTMTGVALRDKVISRSPEVKLVLHGQDQR
ncbi:hypothetical protein AYJ57_20670 (plasmid) [Salipiger sp. CCB-MM3]|uniref:hypothetical protein n=1 Tax=Salipiger sp. CCB-MM3 TaxID=1792508 RepID=UPI00080A99CE|nr:hypothetical protein [Salipiger sp. CCB-MM3]ANT62900.1 hypothetical protein AYJ57_20670 [Salipiger sp. CCB-MM3]